jgi:hypothetical protein
MMVQRALPRSNTRLTSRIYSTRTFSDSTTVRPPLSTSLTRHFDPKAQTQYTSLRQKFLLIEYTATTHRRPFSETRELGFQAPEVHLEMQQFGVQDATYILVAVIRMTDRKREHIRIYSKEGTEIVMAEIGEYREKEPEQPQ